MSEGDRIRWSALSSALKDFGGLDWIEKDSPIPKESCNQSFNNKPINIAEGREDSADTDWSNWFDNAPPILATEQTKGLGAYDVGVVIRFGRDP